MLPAEMPMADRAVAVPNETIPGVTTKILPLLWTPLNMSVPFAAAVPSVTLLRPSTRMSAPAVEFVALILPVPCDVRRIDPTDANVPSAMLPLDAVTLRSPPAFIFDPVTVVAPMTSALPFDIIVVKLTALPAESDMFALSERVEM